jgi:hypothetical protein
VTRRVAAIHGLRNARDERGIVGGEEQRRRRDLLGPDEAPELVLLADPLARCRSSAPERHDVAEA